MHPPGINVVLNNPNDDVNKIRKSKYKYFYIHHVYPTYKSERLKEFPPLAIALKNVATIDGLIGSNVYGATANVTTYYADIIIDFYCMLLP